MEMTMKKYTIFFIILIIFSCCFDKQIILYKVDFMKSLVKDNNKRLGELEIDFLIKNAIYSKKSKVLRCEGHLFDYNSKNTLEGFILLHNNYKCDTLHHINKEGYFNLSIHLYPGNILEFNSIGYKSLKFYTDSLITSFPKKHEKGKE